MTQAHEKPEWAQSRFEKENAVRIANGQKPKRRILRWVILGALLVAGAAYFFLQPAPEPVEVVEDTTPIAKRLLSGEIATIEPVTLSQTVKVTGTLVPAHQSSIAPLASGRVLSVAVSPGDSVEEGQILAEIDRATLELQLNQQRATAEATRIQLVSTRQQLERTEELARQGVTSPSALEQARSSAAALEANLAALESGVETAEIALDNATIRSPLAGVVSSRSIEPGQTINAGTPIFTIVNLEQMEFQASASVNSSALVRPGQSVEVTASGLENTTFDGTVTRVNPVATSGTRVVPIYVSLDNSDELLRGGMFATGFITVAEKPEAIAVPKSAVREDAEGNYVLKLQDGTLVRQSVETGEEWSRGQIVEVEGLDVGDVIVAAALSQLQDGDLYEMDGEQ